MRTSTPGFTNLVNRWVHCMPVIVEENMLMSVHCREKSQKNGKWAHIFGQHVVQGDDDAQK